MGIILNGIIENVSTKPSEMRAFFMTISTAPYPQTSVNFFTHIFTCRFFCVLSEFLRLIVFFAYFTILLIL